MANVITIAERRISGTGLILPTPDQLKYRRYILFADIIRKPISPYLNRDSEPPTTYYGVISLMKGEHLLQTYKVQYDAQIWNFDADIAGQALIAIKCEYLGILQTFVNLGVALNLTPISVENTIANYRNLPLQWDAIIIKCFADCAIQFVLKALPYDYCVEDYKNPADPGGPPAKPPAVDPGVATNISEPYPNEDITNPAAIDLNYTPPPTGNACQPYNVLIQYTTNNGDTTQRLQAYLGPIGRIRKVLGQYGEAASLELESRGAAGGDCLAFGWYRYTGGSQANNFNNPVILSITPT